MREKKTIFTFLYPVTLTYWSQSWSTSYSCLQCHISTKFEAFMAFYFE